MEESVISNIIEAIADERGEEPSDMGFTLHDYVDTDAIQTLLEHDSSSWVLSFEVEDLEVTVADDGVVHVDDSRSTLNA